MRKLATYFQFFALAVSIASLIFVVYNGKKLREINVQTKYLQSETVEIMRKNSLIRHMENNSNNEFIDGRNVSSKCYNSTVRDPLEDNGKEYVVKTVCRIF